MSFGPQTSDTHPLTPRVGFSGSRVLAVAILAALFFGFSLARSPIPGVNESHYLCKARHFWQPDWCRGDLFLESANPHAVFYAVFGGLTTKFSLAQTAMIVRAGQALLLAIGWLALGVRCLGDTRRAVTGACFFLLLQATGTWSGEWLIGGAESKVWGYGCLFLAAAWGLDRRWYLAAVSGGLAVSMHPVVGCWGAVIGLLAWGNTVAFCSARERSFAERKATVLAALTIFLVTSLPGLVPAILSLSAPNPQVASEADFLQVGVRLSHHLDPLTFPVRAWRDYGLLLLVLVLIRHQLQSRSNALVGLERWMVAAILIAAGGVLIAWGPRPLKELPWWQLRVKLLKLYPFRLADMLVPITVSFTVAAGVWQLIEQCFAPRLRPAVLTAVVGTALLIAFRVPTLDKTLDQQPLAIQTDWLAACDWIRAHAPIDAVLYATNDNWSLRWYAERPEYFHFKDCPQDAASIVEWNRRSWVIYHWKLRVFSDGMVSREDLSQLRKETGITHIVCGRFGPVELKPVFLSDNMTVYELPR